MTETIEQLKATLSKLPPAEKAELAEYLLDSLEDEGAATKWLELAHLRMSEVRAGGVVGVPAEQLLEELRGAKS